MRNERRQRVSDNYTLAGLIGTYNAKAWDDKDKIQIPKIWELYEGLFDEEKEQAQQEEIKKAANSRYNYAARHNKKFNKKSHTEGT